jgi:hypothetical protein
MTLTVGPLRAEAGRKARGTVAVDLGPTTVDVPVILVNGARSGPTVVLTGGVHGGEFKGANGGLTPQRYVDALSASNRDDRGHRRVGVAVVALVLVGLIRWLGGRQAALLSLDPATGIATGGDE